MSKFRKVFYPMWVVWLLAAIWIVVLSVAAHDGWTDDRCTGPFESPTCNYVRCMNGECK